MLIRRESPGDVDQVRQVTAAAFARDTAEPVEVRLLDELRADAGWIPALSLVAVDDAGQVDADGQQVVGHVVCTRGAVGDRPALGLGPLSVRPDRQRRGIGSALMHAVLAAADALDEPLVVLLGAPDYYRRFGFRPAARWGVESPDPRWGDYFQARPLTAYEPSLRGRFAYAAPFAGL